MADAKEKLTIGVVESKGSLVVKEREAIPQPGRGEVLLKVEACGICASDHLTVDELMGVKFPRIPGHEIVGIIQKLGENCHERLKVGQRVGVGWTGGYCSGCNACKEGDFITCEKHLITGLSVDGGYATHTIARQEACVPIPDGLTPEEAAPLMCAGVTTFNALRNQGAKPGDLVAIQGIGGLGHLGIQYANKMGFKVVAISSTSDKKELAKKLGAHHYIAASEVKSVPEELKKLGGARVILCTAPDSKAMGDLIYGLQRNGVLVVVGADPTPIPVSGIYLLSMRCRVQGWPSGTGKDMEDTLKFSLLTGVRSINEIYPLAKAQEAFKATMAGKTRFRAVLKA